MCLVAQSGRSWRIHRRYTQPARSAFRFPGAEFRRLTVELSRCTAGEQAGSQDRVSLSMPTNDRSLKAIMLSCAFTYPSDNQTIVARSDQSLNC